MAEHDDYGRHEALHMTSFLARAVDEELLGNAWVKREPAWAKLAREAEEALNALYQLIGAAHCDEPKTSDEVMRDHVARLEGEFKAMLDRTPDFADQVAMLMIMSRRDSKFYETEAFTKWCRTMDKKGFEKTANEILTDRKERFGNDFGAWAQSFLVKYWGRAR